MMDLIQKTIEIESKVLMAVAEIADKSVAMAEKILVPKNQCRE